MATQGSLFSESEDADCQAGSGLPDREIFESRVFHELLPLDNQSLIMPRYRLDVTELIVRMQRDSVFCSTVINSVQGI
jgi:hypothetical protein